MSEKFNYNTPLQDIKPGTAWVEPDLGGPGYCVGCRWPTANAEQQETGYLAFPTYRHTSVGNHDVAVLATDLTAEQCAWILDTDGNYAQLESVERARSLAKDG